ncbi:MAG: nuclear transport factor 2 family protein [Rubripirellula sp.]
MFGVLRLCFRFALFSCSTGVAEAADHPDLEPVKALFAAMSKQDGKAMQDTSTKDFQLLEHGEEWSMQKLVDVVQANGKSHERKNFFKQIRARQTGDMAWVSYWNKAEIQRATELKIIVWLESAVMVKVDGEWKIQMLHSTRVESDKQPKHIKWDPLEAAK